MNSVIWKFNIKPDRFELQLPIGAIVLTVQTQNGIPYIWAVCNPIAEMENRVFLLLGTGCNNPEIQHCKYIGTFQMEGGMLVFHLFEVLQIK
jgi:hypothetical protein